MPGVTLADSLGTKGRAALSSSGFHNRLSKLHTFSDLIMFLQPNEKST